MMCIRKVKQWRVHMAILPAQGALGQMEMNTRYHFCCVEDPQKNGSQIWVLKEYFTSPASTSKSQSTSTSGLHTSSA